MPEIGAGGAGGGTVERRHGGFKRQRDDQGDVSPAGSPAEQASFHFKGNVEGHDLFEGELDVVVCDGFAGNVVLKTAESVAHTMQMDEGGVYPEPWRMLGALLLKPAFNSIKRKADPAMYGGAPLLGVNGLHHWPRCVERERRVQWHPGGAESVEHRVNH
jgi:glycerol-3-phosphate acyltransferase PlsX